MQLQIGRHLRHVNLAQIETRHKGSFIGHLIRQQQRPGVSVGGGQFIRFVQFEERLHIAEWQLLLFLLSHSKKALRDVTALLIPRLNPAS